MMLKTVILECNNIEQLIDFYSKFLDWPVVLKRNEFIRIQSPESGMGIEAHYSEDYVTPVWPSETGKQQMMAHLDFGVNDNTELQKMCNKAVKLGAKIAETQYGNDRWITLLDPAGHPFCIVIWD